MAAPAPNKRAAKPARIAKPSVAITAHGWTIYLHPVLLSQLTVLTDKVEALKTKHPRDYKNKNDAKRLAALQALMFDIIPQDPARAEYRQGGTLGAEYKHWFRAKFFQQYRLFFRYHLTSRVIVFAWVNDDSTLRAYDSKTDAYQVFGRMLKRGKPPDDWDALLAQSS